ncbi:MAG: glycosyltransferase [Patescibacteria group bacterium]
MPKYTLSTISPCLNESQNVVALVERLQATFEKKKINGQIILVNDGSQDNTRELIDGMASKFSNVVSIHHPKNQGIVTGWKSGLKAAEGKFVCLLDADLQNLPEDVGRMYEEINFSHYDVVQGWRSHVKNFSGGRVTLSRGLNFLLNIFYGMDSKDNKSSFLICRKEVLEDILDYRFHYTYFQTNLGGAIKYKGYSIRQMETLFVERRIGKSFLPRFPFKIILETFIDLIKGFVEFRLLDIYDTSLRNYLKDHPPIKEDVPFNWWRQAYFKFFVSLFPLHHWMISFNGYQYYKDLKRSQWLKTKEIKEYQEKRLRALLVHAYNKVSYYREQFDAVGLKPEDIQHMEDLPRLPIITKKIIKENIYQGLMAVDYDRSKAQRVTTSGSTGEPLVVYAEKKQLELRWAATLRSLEWTGYHFGDRQIRLWHKYLGMKGIEVFKEILDAKMSRRKFVPAYEIDDSALEGFVHTIMRYKPVILDGYAESYNLIARYLRNYNYHGWKPKGIMSSGQSLSPESRKIVEEGFGCKVFDKYGAREFAGGTAYECEYGMGYHVVAEGTIIEIIKDGRIAQPGEIGEVVITDLSNYIMPLIRYSIGDLAVQIDSSVPCPCGRGLPRIGQIWGRVQAIIIGTQNQMIPGTFFARLFADYDYAVKRFQVVQEEFGSVTLKIVKASQYTNEVITHAEYQMKKHMGEDLKINIEFVDEVALGRTGKRQHSVSKLDIGQYSKQFSSELYDSTKQTQ